MPPAAAASAGPVLGVEVPETVYLPEEGRGAGDLFGVTLTLPPGAGRGAPGVAASPTPVQPDPDGTVTLIPDEQPTSTARDVELVVDATALAGVAEVADTGACDAAGLVFTCAWPSLAQRTEVRPFALRGAQGVRAGAHATITLTARAAGAADTTARTEAVVGRPVLAELRHDPLRGLSPGEPFTLTPAIANHGELAAPRGIGVRLQGTTGLRLAREYGNCRYKPAPDAAAYCVFATPVTPGHAYTLSAPFHFTPAEDLMYGQVSYDAWILGGDTPDDAASYAVRGSGPALTLEPAADRDFAEPGGLLDVGTLQTADYQAVGGVVEGAVGETVEVALGVQNAGPGSMALAGGTGRYVVTPPEGTTVVGIPGTGSAAGWACDRGGSGSYVCDLPEVFPAGTEDTLVFRVRVDRAVSGAPGRIQSLARTDFPARDAVPANDTAPVLLRVRPATASPSPSTPPASSPASSSPSPPPAPSSHGGAMAPTGISRLVPWLIAASAGALGLGSVTLAMIRVPGRGRAGARQA
ncbi:hypothetical protein AB0M28_30320 [Streptomyces sp. NPDC051940]|uniref:hypothetical protein n=1 Tax=Streptomyces sp. NPDC051940 TaxID=3155675 RepID=UPI0034213BEC